MKYTLIIFFCGIGSVFGQSTRKIDKEQIQQTTINFLEWYSSEMKDTSKRIPILSSHQKPYADGYQRINKEGVTTYIERFRKSGYVSESYLNNLRQLFVEIDSNLEKHPSLEGTLIPGFEVDIVTKLFEPTLILDNIQKGRFDKTYIIDTSALIRFSIFKSLKLLFVYSKIQGVWKIDALSYDKRGNGFINQYPIM